ncbi:hypothetical protein MTY66_42090 [Mycolicibacterium sp. TY66]|nr:hypothetical protein MTY66_42090 [Mycolicibacterium sp. TY66]BCJ79769.1 hypothetical protein MTY81_11420 [Mycolicibacterium sp. TY81]
MFYPADNADGALWCTDRTHFKTPGTMVCTKLHDKGRRWRCRWVDETGRELTKSYAKRAEADAHKRQVDSDLHTGSYIDPGGGTGHVP